MSLELELPHLGIGVSATRSAVRHTPLPGAPLRPVPARVALGAALATGIVADAAGGGALQGIGLSVAMLVAIGGLAASAATIREPAYDSGALHDFAAPDSLRHTGARRAGAALCLAFAALLALLHTIRGSELLLVLDTLALLSAVGVAIALLQPGTPLDPWGLRIRDLVRIAIVRGSDALTGTIRFIAGDAAALFGANPRARLGISGAVLRAIALAGGICAVVALLLVNGDPLFDRATSWLTSWNMPWLSAHVATVLAVSWPVLGATYAVTRPAWIDRAVEEILDGAVESFTLNRVDTIVALGALNALFLLFVTVQVRALFGGQAYVEATTGLTLAEYARSGFFTLVAAVGIVVGVLVVIDARSNTGALAAWPVGRRLARVLLALLGVVLASAVARMALYISSYGVSIDRVIAVTILTWLAMVLLIVDRFLLRGRRRGFVFASLGAAALTLAGLNIANPEALIVRAAAARADRGGEVDVEYVRNTVTEDGMPTLVDALVAGRFDEATTIVPSSTSPSGVARPASDAQRTTAACRLSAHAIQWSDASTLRDPRTWTLSAMRARRAVNRHRDRLVRSACFADLPAPARR